MLEKLLIRSRAVPSDPPKRRGATSLGPERDRFGLLRAVLSAVPWGQALMGAGIVLLAALVPWGTSEVLSAMDRQVMAIDVKGELVGENRTALERSAGKWIGRSFFATDLSDIKESLEQRPWVESAAVKRVWPDRLQIDVREKKPLAYWNSNRLPRLAGPDERVKEVIDMARTMSDTLTGHNLGFAGLSLEQRGAWTLTLANGIEVVLGRDQVEARFERFVTVYQERLASRSDEVRRVDARYSNGVAVQWKPSETASRTKS